MENYKALSIQYLKMNKRRTILTMLGTSLTVLLLYVLLNLTFSYIDSMREKAIEDVGDYEMIFYTETPEQVKEITNNPVVKKAYVGSWYEYITKKTYENALFVKGDNPYRMEKNFESLKETYGIDGELNEMLAAFYMQGDESNLTYILILFLLLVSYIFAIFGVGVIRNSIQLSLFEQIKDYGNLRCIGASVGQLRAIIYLQSAIMETVGIVLGITVGQLGMSLVGLFISFDLGMHLPPVVLILIAYYGDLYFAMEENCKLVTGMTPVSALKGEFRIRKEKLKRRRKSIFARLFGIEGDYAYKSLLRSPGKFFKSVGAMFFGITALIACLGIVSTVDTYLSEIESIYQYYQFYYTCPIGIGESIDEAQTNLPAVEQLKSIAEIEAVTAVKKIYRSEVMLADENALLEKIDDTYLNETSAGALYRRAQDSDEEHKVVFAYMSSTFSCYGYDEEDYARYKEDLVEGTLDISENGIVIMNGTRTGKMESESLVEELIDTQITDYKIGDTIDIVDTKKLNAMVKEVLSNMPEDTEDGLQYRYDKIAECRDQLIQQGDYKTYVIEGILDNDTNYENAFFSIILPLDRYFEMTGTNENDVVGMRYHLEKDKMKLEDFNRFYFWDENRIYDESEYPYLVESLWGMKKTVQYILAFMLFVVTVSSVNIINTTASNIHLRRKEFAQLRVIGVSKKRLIRMVMLEGVITTIVANILGMIVGNMLSYGVYYYMNMLLGMKYSIPWLGMILGLLLSVFVLCGSVYVPLMSLRQDMAAELAASGE